MTNNSRGVPGDQVGDFLKVLDGYREEDFPKSSLKKIENKVPGLTIARAGGHAPFTAEGIIEKLPFYLKFKSDGKASLRVGENPVEKPLYLSRDIFDCAGGEQISFEEFTELLFILISRLRPAPFQYDFAGTKITLHGSLKDLCIEATDEIEIFKAWGATGEEAFQKIASPSSELMKLGFSATVQEEIFRLQGVNPRPLNVDDRIFPDPTPSFMILK